MTSQEKATEKTDLQGIKSFEVRKVQGKTFMGLPSNIEALGETNYLYKLLVKANNINKIIGVKCTQEYTDTMANNKDVQSFLHGFGVPLVIEDIPNIKVKTKGMFGRGLSCAIKYIIANIKKADSSLLKLSKCKSAAEEVFKDPWGKANTTEKRLLDNIILALKKVKTNEVALKTWYYPLDKIKEKNGIRLNIVDNPLIDEIERKYIRSDFEQSKAAASTVVLEIKDETSGIVAFSEAVRALIKDFKPLKDFVNDLVSLRLKCVYGHRDNQALKRRKKPIGDLVRNIRNTKEYLVAFNIGRGLRVHPPFIVTYFPATDGEYRNMRTQIQEWAATIGGTDENKARAVLVSKWLEGAISE